LGREFDLSGSLDVIGHVTIRYAISYWWSIGTKPLSLNGFRDIQRQM